MKNEVLGSTVILIDREKERGSDVLRVGVAYFTPLYPKLGTHCRKNIYFYMLFMYSKL